MTDFEVAVLGGGPAACAAATLLARRSHRVVMVRPTAPQAAELGQSVTPTARRVLNELGLLEAVEGAGFHPNTGNTAAWAGQPPRAEDFADSGFHVDRRGLEGVLGAAAEAAGATVLPGRVRNPAEVDDRWEIPVEGEGSDERALEADWVIDATGRHGVLARHNRSPDRDTTTLAVVQRVRADGMGAAVPIGHTAVESHETGWVFTIPLDDSTRCVTAMLDQRRHDGAESLEELLRGELARAPFVAASLDGWRPIGETWACPASLHTSDQVARRGLLLAGDASSTIDPLSSFGVKKALSSGWLAGIAVHTALVDPALADDALAFYSRRERTMYETYRASSAVFFQRAAEAHRTPFWEERAAAAATFADQAGGTRDPDEPPVTEEEVRSAFEVIRGLPELKATRAPGVRLVELAGIQGNRIVRAPHAASDDIPEGVRFVRGVDIPALISIAPEHPAVPDGWEAYNAVAPPVTLPDYLTALSTTFALGLLRHEGGD